MNERITNQDSIASPEIPEIIEEISELKSRLKSLYTLRDNLPGGFLPEDTYLEIKQLHKLKEQKTIDLILADSLLAESKLQIVLRKYRGEKLHPFSMNKVTIYVPSIKVAGSDYFVKTELSNLRRPELIEDSLDAQEFLGQTTISYETGQSFAQRTASELVKIGDLQKHIAEGKGESTYTYGQLENLSAELITDRLLPLKNSGQFPPNSSLGFVLYKTQNDVAICEKTRLFLKGRPYNFLTSGQRLGKIVAEQGGYEESITVNT